MKTTWKQFRISFSLFGLSWLTIDPPVQESLEVPVYTHNLWPCRPVKLKLRNQEMSADWTKNKSSRKKFPGSINISFSAEDGLGTDLACCEAIGMCRIENLTPCLRMQIISHNETVQNSIGKETSLHCHLLKVDNIIAGYVFY